MSVLHPTTFVIALKWVAQRMRAMGFDKRRDEEQQVEVQSLSSASGAHGSYD